MNAALRRALPIVRELLRADNPVRTSSTLRSTLDLKNRASYRFRIDGDRPSARVASFATVRR